MVRLGRPRPLPLDARLDPYRNRVALLCRAGHLVGHLLVLTERVEEPRGWRGRANAGRSGETVTTRITFQDGNRGPDERLEGVRLDAELERWRRSEFVLAGETLSMRWLGPAESREVIRHGV